MLDVKTRVSPSRKKSKRKVAMEMLAIIVVLAVLVVFAVLLLGPVFGPLIGSVGMNGPASGGLADSALKQDVWNSIKTFEHTNGCTDVISDAITVTQQPSANGVWTEGWSVNACGHTRVYNVQYTTNSVGTTVYSFTK